MSPFGNSRDANASNCGHCVESNHDDNERSASSPQEEYLEMDYASEIEECSRYTFSQLVHTYDMTVADECDTEERWLRHQQRAYARESADAHETWLERMRVQQEETAAGMYGAVSLRLLLGEARHRHLAHLRQCGDVAAEAVARQEWRRLAQRVAGELEVFNYEQVRRTISTMYLFEPACMSLQYGSNAAHVREVICNRERVLQQLRERGQLFLASEATSPSSNSNSNNNNNNSSSDSRDLFPCAAQQDADTLSMCVFLVMPLDPVALDSEQRDLGDGAVCSPDGSLHSGGGASSSGHSSDSDDLGDDCFSPPALADGGWLVESCL